MLAVVYTILVVVMLRQFGSRLSPSRSLGWWTTFLLLGIAVVDANIFGGLAAALGFQLISNFLFATMLLLVMFELVSQSSFFTKTARQFRRFVAQQAASDFLKEHGPKNLPATPRTLIVVPCYNEEAALPSTLATLKQLAEKLKDQALICLVDDGSRDRTWKTLLAARSPAIGVIRHGVNIGVGGVLLTAFTIQRELDLEFVIQCDADGQHPAGDIPALIAEARAGKFDLLIGSRFAAPPAGEVASKDQSSTAARRGGGIIIRFCLGLFGRQAMVDDPTSGFRVFSYRLGMLLLERMPDEYPEPETIALAARHGFRIGERRVVMAERVAGESSIGRLAAVRYMYKVITALVGLRLMASRR